MSDNSLRLYEIRLRPQQEEKLSQSVGSIFHGLLMEQMTSTKAGEFHEQGRRAYSQAVIYDRESHSPVWRIGTLTNEVGELFETLLQRLPSTVYLKQKQLPIDVVSVDCVKATSYEALADTYLGSGREYGGIQIQALTSVALKSGGRYVLFPDVEAITDNLLRRWNTFSTSEVIENEGAAQAIASNLHIDGYHLSLQPFALEKIRVPAFRGTISLRLHSNIILSRLAAMLATYAEFSGIGIKTALGMGHVATMIKEKL